MRILFLGPACPAIEKHLVTLGHSVEGQEAPLQDDFLQMQTYDFALSYRYLHIIPTPIVQYFGKRIINLHISMLPWNRGNDPNLWSFLENTPKGVTIHIINEGLDKGDILLQQEVHIDVTTDTLRTSWEKLSRAIERLFLDNAEDLLAGKIQPKPQVGKGSYHRTTDKMRYIHLLEQLWWDTPVKMLEGAALESEK